jgi:hypothetical protein
MAVLEDIRRTGVHTEISRCDLTEKRMYVKVRSPEVAASAPRLLDNYRSPFSGQRGVDNPLVFGEWEKPWEAGTATGAWRSTHSRPSAPSPQPPRHLDPTRRHWLGVARRTASHGFSRSRG